MDYGQIIDTRQLIERAAEIEDELADESLGDLDAEDRAELQEELDAIQDAEQAGISDWQYGETLIREDYFEEYARQLADDIGAVSADAQWPTSYIDWEAAAEALKNDYTTIELDGSTYYGRA